MIDFTQFKSVIAVINHFNNEEVCKQTLAEVRWGDDVVCPHCGKHHCVRRADGRYRCNHCKHNFSCTTGTIFQNTKLPLQKWFIAMYLISSHKKGVSSLQIMRDCEVCQKTAWFILHKVRSLYGQNDSVSLKGEVEMDEMYLGGREANKHESKKTEGTQGRSTKTKTPIFGMIQRNGNIVAMKVDNTKGATIMPIVSQFVENGATTYTDEANIYNSLTKNGYEHLFVNHSQREYVRANDIHTCGGGGIPVLETENGDLEGTAAVIDKDFAAELLAENVEADALMILTEVEKVAINFNKPNQENLGHMTYAEAEKHCQDGQFAPGSMLPKVQAAMKFVRAYPGKRAIITSLDKAIDALEGKTGTVITFA